MKKVLALVLAMMFCFCAVAESTPSITAEDLVKVEVVDPAGSTIAIIIEPVEIDETKELTWVENEIKTMGDVIAAGESPATVFDADTQAQLAAMYGDAELQVMEADMIYAMLNGNEPADVAIKVEFPTVYTEEQQPALVIGVPNEDGTAVWTVIPMNFVEEDMFADFEMELVEKLAEVDGVVFVVNI